MDSQLIFLLAIIACMVHGAPLTIEQNPTYSLEDGEIRANLDKVVDNLLPSIHEFILKHGMDPMQLIDISDEPIFPNLSGKFKGNINLKKGWMQNLSQVKRTKQVNAIYKNKRLTLDMNLGFDIMDFNYEYDLTHLLYKRRGEMFGRLHKPDINVVMTIDLNEYQMILNSIKFSQVNKYDIRFEGNLLDPIVNALTKMVVKIFPKRILSLAEHYAMRIFGGIIDEWNTKISRAERTEILNRWLDIAKV